MPRFDHVVVHAFALTAAGVGGGLAQLPCADAPVLISLQTAMILALAQCRGVPLDEAAATQLVLTFGATMLGRTASQALGGRIPAWGNALNATTAAGLTEAIGWAAVAWFESQRRQREGSER